MRRLRSCTLGALIVAVLACVQYTTVLAQQRPLAVQSLKKLAAGGVSEDRLLELVKERGIDFAPTQDVLEDLRRSSVPDTVIEEVARQIPRGQTRNFYLSEGYRLVTQKRYEEAITYYKKILEESPDDPDALARIADIAQLQVAEKERARLPEYRQELLAALQKPDCAMAKSLAMKIRSLAPQDKEVEAAVSECYQPYALKQTFTGHTDRIYTLAFSPDGLTLASGSDDKSIKFWDVRGAAPSQTLFGKSAELGALGRLLAGPFQEPFGIVRCLAFDPRGKLLAAGSYRSVEIWDLTAQKRMDTLGRRGFVGAVVKGALPESHAPVRSLAFNPDGRLLASAGRDEEIKLWNAVTWNHTKTLRGHKGTVYTVAFSPDGRLLASGSEDQTVIVWNVEAGKLRRTVRGHSQAVYGVAFSPDGSMLASASGDKTIRLWDLGGEEEKQTLRGHSGSVYAVTFSRPDGRLVASGGEDNAIRIWDAATGALKQTLSGHNMTVHALAFSPDGRLLASGSWDKTVKLWERQ